MLPGPVGERLLSGAPCAVAIAPRGYSATESRRLGLILVAFDGSPEARLALHEAHALAACADAGVRALTVIVPSSPSVADGEVVPMSGLDAIWPLPEPDPSEAVHLADALERQVRAANATLEAAIQALGAGTAIEPGGGRRPRPGVGDTERGRRARDTAGARLAGLGARPPFASRQRIHHGHPTRSLPGARNPRTAGDPP